MEWYKGKIAEHVDNGYAYKMTTKRALNPFGPVWYLLHFDTINKNKGNKRCLVFDAAAKCHGLSLNDNLLKGPPQLQPKPLTSILMHFREQPFTVVGDIGEMFHRVRIINKDQ